VSKLLTAIGLMSGTSLDGIDVAMLRTDGRTIVERGPSETFPYSTAQRQLLHDALRAGTVVTDRDDRTGVLGEAEAALTTWHAQAVQVFMQRCSLRTSNIDLISFHGQTIIHRPEQQLTVQLGNGKALAKATGIDVAYDLRAADVAAGGQGAPLVPAYHQALAAKLIEAPVAFVNIGGVANVTYVAKGQDPIAFDTGPGNALIDDWMLKHTGAARDEGGQSAMGGTVDDAAVKAFLQHPFFSKPGPKSLDRNSFPNLEGMSLHDGAATLVAMTARSVLKAAEHFPSSPKCWIICGGGRHNAAIMKALAATGEKIVKAEDQGLNGDSMEAEAWAYLGVRAQLGLPLTFPTTTGVKKPMTGGIMVTPG
jgi:anhydro-N-acetylmuramic acid kinase